MPDPSQPSQTRSYFEVGWALSDWLKAVDADRRALLVAHDLGRETRLRGLNSMIGLPILTTLHLTTPGGSPILPATEFPDSPSDRFAVRVHVAGDENSLVRNR